MIERANTQWSIPFMHRGHLCRIHPSSSDFFGALASTPCLYGCFETVSHAPLRCRWCIRCTLDRSWSTYLSNHSMACSHQVDGCSFISSASAARWKISLQCACNARIVLVHLFRRMNHDKAGGARARNSWCRPFMLVTTSRDGAACQLKLSRASQRSPFQKQESMIMEQSTTKIRPTIF